MKKIFLLRKIGVYVCAAWWMNIILLFLPLDLKYMWASLAILSIAIVALAITKVNLEKKLTP